MTTLAEKGRLRGQEFPAVAAMGRMARQAVFLHGRMLPQEGTPFFSMALVAEFIHVVRLDHFRPEAAMLVMALGAFHQSLFQRVMGLPALLRPDIPVAVIAECGFLCLQVHLRSRMGTVAVVAGNAVDLVPAQIPEGHGPRFLVAGKTLCRTLFRIGASGKGKDARSLAAPLLHMGRAGAVAGFTGILIGRASGNRFFCVAGFLVALIIVAMTGFADFRSCDAVIAPRISEKKGRGGDYEQPHKKKSQKDLFFLHLR